MWCAYMNVDVGVARLSPACESPLAQHARSLLDHFGVLVRRWAKGDEAARLSNVVHPECEDAQLLLEDLPREVHRQLPLAKT